MRKDTVMANNRVPRTNEDVARALSVILRNIKDPRINQGMVSVTSASVTPDLKFCKVYVSVLGLTSEREFMRGIKSASGFIRRELSQSLNLRATPELTFVLDHSIEHGAHISKLLDELDIQPEEPENADAD
ncbi:MAG: 30S ribosome-binding factor RbfA [Oscillospiraceae bacterium]|nr:30S ribosome-binding factor RbfA [Oscillospiraceae bacterium]